MKRILFQGDSITDCGRARDNNTHVGTGYAVLVKSQLGFENPGEYEFYNKGISGNRIVDLYARIKADIINLSPDYISILIGVNDVWHEFFGHNGVDADKYEKIGAAIDAANSSLIKKVFVTDTYEDENGKSITVRIIFSQNDRTLTREEVMEVVDGIVEKLKADGINLKQV